MTAEWVAAVASVGTLLVIAATAIAAIVQLRHIRAANQLTGLLRFSELFESDEMQEATHFIEHDLLEKLHDPNFVAGLLETNTDRREHRELRVCDFMEQQGSYVKFGMIEKAQYLDVTGAYVTSMWVALKGVVALRRAARNSSAIYENFEYLASISQSSDSRHKSRRPAPELMPESEWRRIAQRYMSNAGLSSVEKVNKPATEIVESRN